MSYYTRLLQKARLFTASLIVSLLFYSTAMAETISVPVNTRIYVEIDQDISGKKKHTRQGQIVRASVWQDVVIGGHTVIAAGTPVLVRVDSIKGSKIAGGKGKMTLGAYETTLVDNSKIQLGGGYYKEGKGKVALAVTLAVVVFLPLIFIKGKSAHLPRGTVFDAYIDRATNVEIAGYTQSTGPTIDLTSVMEEGFSAEVLYNELEGVAKPKIFAFDIQAPVGNSGKFVIDRVNGQSIKALKLEASQTGAEDDMEYWRGEISIKKFVKQLKKGINTFEISTIINGERVSKEIILDIQI